MIVENVFIVNIRVKRSSPLLAGVCSRWSRTTFAVSGQFRN
jgi:hypothetical protein